MSEEGMTDRAGTPFEMWLQHEGIPVIRGYSVKDLYQVPVGEWEMKGGLGAWIVLEGGEGRSGAYVCEIPPGKSLKPQKHLYEEQIFILSGKGATTVWSEGGPKHTFEWQEGSLFSIPLNVRHQHFNGQGDKPVRYVATNDAPLAFNLYNNPDFIFGCDYVFKDRYAGEKDYFDGKGKLIANDRIAKETRGQVKTEDEWYGGFIQDVRQVNLQRTVYYGKGFRHLTLHISKNSWGAHLARVEVGGYKKAHRHGGGAHILVVEGTGYALMYPEGGEIVRADFQKGSLYSPPEGWWHHHFNTGTEEALQIAFRGIPMGKQYWLRVDRKKGGDMLEFEDEPPIIRKVFDEELAKKGIKSIMSPVKR